MNTNHSNKQEQLSTIRDFKFLGVPLIMFAVFAIILWLGMGFGLLPTTSLSILALLLSIALPLRWIGDHTPFLGKYVGFGPLLTIFGPSLLVTVGYITPDVQEYIGGLQNDVLIPLNIGALMCGAVLGRMDRSVLLKALIRYIPVIVLALVTTVAVVAGVGTLLGIPLFDSIVLYSFSTFSGGTGAPMVLIPAMLNDYGLDGGSFAGIMLAACSLANIEAMCLSGILDAVGRKKPGWTGNGNLVRTGGKIAVNETKASFDGKIGSIATGIFVCSLLFGTANIIASIMSPIIDLNYVVWLILLCLILKMLNIIPQHILNCVAWSSDLVIAIVLPALMVSIGISNIDLIGLIQSINLEFFIIVTVVVLTYVISAGLYGRLFGLYPIESAISVGCCSCDLGGTGDLLNCQISKRMDLYPFASISTRIGGAIALLFLGFLLPFIV